MEYDGRVILGDVTGYVITPSGAVYLRVNYFNGEEWPLSPRACAVHVLDREWTPRDTVAH
jgi:hypothetical protein